MEISEFTRKYKKMLKRVSLAVSCGALLTFLVTSCSTGSTSGIEDPAGTVDGDGDTGTSSTTVTEVTRSTGIPSIQQGMGWFFDFVVEDINNDGHLDMFLGDHSTHHRLATGNGDGTFSDVTVSVFENTDTGVWSTQAFDYNNDNLADIFINWNSQASTIFRNDGGNNFTRFGKYQLMDNQAGGTAWGDIDADGYPDLLVSLFETNSRLWWNNKGNMSNNIASEAGVAGYAMPPVFFADFNNDMWPDIYITALQGSVFAGTRSTKIRLNKAQTGAPGFASAPVKDLEQAPGNGVALGDYDNDGDLDVFACGSSTTDVKDHQVRLYENDGNAVFTDITSGSGLPQGSVRADEYRIIYWQAASVDINNDGLLDVLATGPGGTRIYRNAGNMTFQDITDSMGLAASGGRPARIYVADYDNDGDMDVFFMNGQGDGYHIWRNNLNDGNWLKIRLEGNQLKTAVGSKIYIYEEGHLGEAEYLAGYREVIVATSHRSPLEQHFGLKQNQKYDIRIVFWPEGNEVEMKGIDTAQRLRVLQNGTYETF